mmetsp:Transcript_4089/g.6031  ORF Transcript_4089/g.6031 Transcript_4089/m.6031 type:complete len:116 (-) Transcript_4089:314-661(-)|eukprot:CAMPEP_0194082042 /NCGR_PEP_ID=MMETSP0149-20130528/7661_1 /TAXON_ID=122233 /ORGANISM="Chaetoceros debilis, Strain MM31A-1" /LENGTH=115 /DNA_ID=CAMNT_0038764091 /DNA_START=44 /DNA_END=391 /DNA_ORIENTATION=-
MVTTRSATQKATEEAPPKKNEEIDNTQGGDEAEEEEITSTIEQKLRKKKPLPSVGHLLQHGAKDPNAPPESFLQSLFLPSLLLLTFIVSGVVWHFMFLKDSGPVQRKNWSRPTEL